MAMSTQTVDMLLAALTLIAEANPSMKEALTSASVGVEETEEARENGSITLSILQ